ncbi:unnamed protein product [Clavelina lepadiformis]|uniref:CHAT domain-containing protein n=1 Tax=Clavelina lepadiformis TaxID=159417 RepID=A0ABP0F3I9_CLALP
MLLKEIPKFTPNRDKMANEERRNLIQSHLNSLIGENSKEEISKHIVELLRLGREVVSLPENIDKQDVVTQLYIMGCSLQRNGEIKLSISTLDAAIEICRINLEQKKSDSLNTDEVLLMKMYYELACCEESDGQLDKCLDHYEACIALTLYHNDIMFEKQVLMRMGSALMQNERCAEAASAYLRMTSLQDDIIKALKDDTEQYRYHWSLDCDCEIHHNLCLAYMALSLYERALEEAFKFKELLQSIEPGKNIKGVTHMMQANFLIGKIYELLGDRSSALVYYQEWLTQVHSNAYLQVHPDDKLLVELASAYQNVGTTLLNQGRSNESFAFFEKMIKTANQLSDKQMEVEGLLLQGDSKLVAGRVENAREIFKLALKLGQNIPGNDSLECKCMKKDAEAYAHEGRYTHALYRCERALQLARKVASDDVILSLECQVALYTQHSTSEKELLAAVKFLSRHISEEEQVLYMLRSEDVSALNEKEKNLCESYKAIQVILHRLGENLLSIAFGECWKRREMLQARKKLPQIPSMEHKGFSGVDKEFESSDYISIMQVDKILSPGYDLTIVVYSTCQQGFLAHVLRKGQVTCSYLLSDHVVDPTKVIDTVQELTDLIRDERKDDPASNLTNIYNTESRSLPTLTQKSPIKLPISRQPTAHMGGGDTGSPPDKTTSPSEFNKSLALKGILIPVEGGSMVKAGTVAANPAEGPVTNPYTKLHAILLGPLAVALNQLKPGSSICFVPDGVLWKIPFDQLVGSTGRPLGEDFNIMTSPSIMALANYQRERETMNFDGNSKSTIRTSELMKTYAHEYDLASLQKAGLEGEISGLVSATSTGTNVLTARRYFTPYRQVEIPRHACVIGSTSMTNSLKLNGEVWSPKRQLSEAQEECRKVAEYLDCRPIIGVKATKKKFLSELRCSNLMHIATYADMEKGLLAFCPDQFPQERPPVSMERYIITEEDLVLCEPFNVQLAILSSGQQWQSIGETGRLANVLLNAGVQCVIYCLWPVPDVVLRSFYHHLYLNLQTSCQVSRAVFNAKQALKSRHPDAALWNAFVAIGSDVTIDISKIRAAELQRSISESEPGCLNLPPLVESGDSPEQCFCKLQGHLSRLSGNLDVTRDSDVISFFLGLVEEATDRLTRDENFDKPIVVLPEAVADIKGSLGLLYFLGFDFQSIDVSSLPAPARRSYKGKHVRMVIFPHWNQDDLLLPTHQALTGLHDLFAREECLRAIALMLPLPQHLLCRLIDLLSIIHHTPEVQLRTTDVGARTLWAMRDVRRFLRTIGVIQVRNLLIFCRNVEARSLVVGALHMLLALCLYRESNVLEQLDVESLGNLPRADEEVKKDFKSIDAVLMPRNEVLMRSSWMSDDRYVKEKDERLFLANQIADLSERYSRALVHAKWWHRDVKVPQQAANSFTSAIDGSRTDEGKVLKVKVKSGATPSSNRTVLEGGERPDKSLFEVLKRREEAGHILYRRCVDLERRRATALRSCYLPYTHSE